MTVLCLTLASLRQLPLLEGKSLQEKPVWCPRSSGCRTTGTPAGRCNHPLSRSPLTFCPIGFLHGRLSRWAENCVPPSHIKCLLHIAFLFFQEEEVRCCHVICPTLLKTSFSTHRFLFYSLTASDDSEGTTLAVWYQLAQSWCTMVQESKLSTTPNNITLLTARCPP